MNKQQILLAITSALGLLGPMLAGVPDNKGVRYVGMFISAVATGLGVFTKPPRRQKGALPTKEMP